MIDPDHQRLIEHITIAREHLETILYVKKMIAFDDIKEAVLAMDEISNEDKIKLWRAPSKGSIWTTEERKAMKSNEWYQTKQSL